MNNKFTFETKIDKKPLALLKNYNPSEPCKKQIVKAILITKDGNICYGSNSINAKVDQCPREIEGFPSGKGYHLCKSICKQNEHAEVVAITEAKNKGYDINNAKIFITGHTYFCDNCIDQMHLNNISHAFCYDSNLHLIFKENVVICME